MNDTSKDRKAQADGMVSDYKSRLAPYVDAMKQRGYFGEAIKLKATEDAQRQVANERTSSQMTQPQTSANGKPTVKPQGTQLPMTGADPAASGQSYGDLNHGLDQPDGDFLGVSKEVKPDSGDQSRAPDVASANRPKPASSAGFMNN